MEGKMTYGDKYGPAMEITDPDEALKYFEECVQHAMTEHGSTRAEAEGIVRSNLGYFAGFYDKETRLRVERLFCCAHPIFGKAADGVPTPEEAFEAGKRAGAALKQKECDD